MDRETENRKPPWPRRRKIILSSSIGLAIVLIVGGVTLPRWLPRSVIADRIIGQIRGQTGLDVSVGDISLSWSDGVRISDLRISSPASFGGGTMVDVGAIRTEFSPWRMVSGKKIEWVEVDDPRIMIAIDSDGNVNAAALAKLNSDLHIGRITVRRAVASLKVPDKEQLLSVNVGELELIKGRPDRIGKITMSADLQQSGENAPVKLSVRPGNGADAIDARVDFSNINLQELQLEKLAGLPLAKLSGKCSGFVELNVTRQAKIKHFAIDVAINGLSVVPRDGPALPTIDNAGFALTAAYDPITGRLDMQSAKVQLPGFEVTGQMSAHADLLESSWKSIESLQMAGTVRPDAICLLMTGQKSFPNGWRISGPVKLDGNFAYGSSKLSLKTRMDASRAAISIGETTVKPFGVKCSADVDGNIDDRSWDLQVVRNRIEFGDNMFSGMGGLSDCRALIAGLFSDGGHTMTFPDVVEGILSRLTWKGDMTIGDMVSLRQSFPSLDSAMKNITLALPISGECSFEGPGGCKFEGALSLPSSGTLKVDRLAVDLSRRPVSCGASFRLGTKPLGVSELSAHMAIGKSRINLSEWNVSVGDDQNAGWDVSGQFKAEKIDDILSLPGLNPLADLAIVGDASGSCQLKLDREFRPRGQVALDLSTLGVVYGQTICLQPGQLGKMTMSLSPAELPTVRMVSESSLGRISCDLDVLDVKTRRFGVGLRASLDVDRILAASMLTKKSLGRIGLSGSTDISLRATMQGDNIECDLLADAEKIAFGIGAIDGLRELGELKKESGVASKLATTFTIKGGKSVSIHSASATFGDVSAQFDGQLGASLQADGKPLVELNKWRVAAVLADLSSLTKFAPALDVLKLSGSIQAEFSGGGMNSLDCRASLKNVKFLHKGLSPGLKGGLEISAVADKSSPVGANLRFKTDSLEFNVDKTHGWLVAELAGLPSSPTGTCNVLFDNVDEKSLTDQLVPSEDSSTSRPARASEDEVASLKKKVADLVAVGRKTLAAAELKISIYAQKSNVFDKSVGQCYPMLNRHIELQIARGKIGLLIDAGLNGGTMNVRIATDLNEQSPKLSYDARLRHVMATDSIQPQLAKYFPGNTVHDSFDRSENVVYSLDEFVMSLLDPRCKPTPTGKGMMVAHKGTLIGRAAPYFITNIFPGLNMAEYDYQTMTCFSTYLPSGVAENDMIFSGDIYDVYIEGTTSAEHIGEYQMGLVLGGQGAYWNHEWKQLRFPLLKFKGRIEGGMILDQEVSYHWPTETAFIVLLKNNAAYRLWVNNKAKQQQSQQPSPSSQPLN